MTISHSGLLFWGHPVHVDLLSVIRISLLEIPCHIIHYVWLEIGL